MKQKNIFYSILFFICSTGFFGETSAETMRNNPVVGELHIVIVTASYKNAHWFTWNLNSVFNQCYHNWHMIYVDDCSPDNTGELVEAYVKECGFQDKVTVIRNKRRCGAMSNQYFAIHNFCKPTDIVIILDGDDWFWHKDVLATINNVYADGNTWLTYGQFKEYPNGALGFCSPIPDDVIKNNTFRNHEHIPSHLRTFYAGLFQKIRLEDLITDGSFYDMCADIAAMFPMIEMARDHFKFIPDVLLTYNASNPINDYKVSRERQRYLDLKIRSSSRYEKIETPF